ncbi:MAG: hypothetical protein AABY85_02680 [Gemmatimonadota bacterium]
MFIGHFAVGFGLKRWAQRDADRTVALVLLLGTVAGCLPAYLPPAAGPGGRPAAGPAAAPALRVSSSPVPGVTLTSQTSGTTALLQAVSAVSERVVWVSGHAATYARTTDGGATWQAAIVPGADSLQFRDVYAVSARTAYLLAAGPGARSRIYQTTNGGRSWRLQFTNPDSSAFFDCFDFWDRDHGIAVSDAVNGRLVIITTGDGGATWTRVPDAAIPPALAGEAAFAASGHCVTVSRDDYILSGSRLAWVGTGAAEGARVYRTTDGGAAWEAFPTPVVHGAFSGIAAVAFRNPSRGLALGGQLGVAEGRSDNVAVTEDGGRTWRIAAPPTFTGAAYGAVYVPGASTPTVVAVGPKGMSYSGDEAGSWTSLDTLAYWSVGFARRTGWAVGPGGRITRIDLAR